MGKNCDKHSDSTDPSIVFKVLHAERVSTGEKIECIADPEQDSGYSEESVLLSSMASADHDDPAGDDDDKIQ
jgi:hypothetical protein